MLAQLFLQLINFDYGMRDRNPIDDVRFYQKDKMDVPMVVRREEVRTTDPSYSKILTSPGIPE